MFFKKEPTLDNYINKANKYLDNENYEDAFKLLNKAILQFPNNPYLYYLRSEANMESNHLKESINDLENSISCLEINNPLDYFETLNKETVTRNNLHELIASTSYYLASTLQNVNTSEKVNWNAIIETCENAISHIDSIQNPSAEALTTKLNVKVLLPRVYYNRASFINDEIQEKRLTPNHWSNVIDDCIQATNSEKYSPDQNTIKNVKELLHQAHHNRANYNMSNVLRGIVDNKFITNNNLDKEFKNTPVINQWKEIISDFEVFLNSNPIRKDTEKIYKKLANAHYSLARNELEIYDKMNPLNGSLNVGDLRSLNSLAYNQLKTNIVNGFNKALEYNPIHQRSKDKLTRIMYKDGYGFLVKADKAYDKMKDVRNEDLEKTLLRSYYYYSCAINCFQNVLSLSQKDHNDVPVDHRTNSNINHACERRYKLTNLFSDSNFNNISHLTKLRENAFQEVYGKSKVQSKNPPSNSSPKETFYEYLLDDLEKFSYDEKKVSDLYLKIGNLKSSRGDIENATKDYNTAIGLNEKSSTAYLNLLLTNNS